MIGPPSFTAGDALDLLDWRRAIFDLYAGVRASADPHRASVIWREARDALLATHPQSPLAAGARRGFGGCRYYDYDPVWRTVGAVEALEPQRHELPASVGAGLPFARVGLVRFELQGASHELELSWNEGYGGGLFLAFADSTSGVTTYGGGRYLLDTVKGADLGFDRERRTIVLDFNFAYNPSCSYDGRWACPLAPAANRLPLAVTAGEQHPT